MDFKKLYELYKYDESIVSKLGFNPYYIALQSGLGEKIIIDNQEYINLASNNYLGLANDEKVKKDIIKAVEKYGASLCGTPIATGYVSLYREVEDKLAKFIGLEEALLFPSCYQANIGVFSTFIEKCDLVLVDRFAHSSLVQGIMATGCKIRPFMHNNIEHLESILRKISGYKNIFVVTESVFSTDGTIAPYKDIVSICKKYNVMPVIDDSHGIGVIGNSGRGILEEAGIEDYDGIYTASLGKAIANSGGVVAAKKEIITCLKYYCPHLVYSTALTPATLAGINSVLDIINIDFKQLQEKLFKYKKIVYDILISKGFEVVECKAPINSIKAGTKENTISIAKKFFEAKILTTPFVEPSVPYNEGRVRVIAGSNLKEESLREIRDRL